MKNYLQCSVSVLPPGGIIVLPDKQRPRGVWTRRSLDHKTTKQAVSLGKPTAPPAPVPATEPKPNTDLNPVSRAPNIRFPVSEFFTDDLDLWFFLLEATFIVNQVTTEKDKYAVFVANLPYSVVQRIPRNLVTETTPYTILKELVV